MEEATHAEGDGSENEEGEEQTKLKEPGDAEREGEETNEKMMHVMVRGWFKEGEETHHCEDGSGDLGNHSATPRPLRHRGRKGPGDTYIRSSQLLFILLR